MKNNFKKMLLLTMFLTSLFTYAQTNYYFSSSRGNDANSGTQSDPFQTIAKLNSLSLSPGDKIFFKRNDTFIGQIIIDNSGTDGSPIVFDSYGTGDLPVLSGSNGDNGTPDPRSTIRITGEEYLEFHNLRIENERFDSNGTSADDDKSYGIYFQSFLTLPGSGNFEDRELFDHFRFSNLHFENIYSVNTSGTTFNQLRSSAIHFFEAFVNDVIIEDCHFTNLERVGVWMRKYASDVILRNNQFIDIGGSGAIFSQAKRVLYEGNIMRFCGSDSNPKMIGRGSGMWVFASDDVVAQYNISQHARGNGDSSGMHVDYSNTNILFQYNYSEDSAGGFCEILGNNDNVIWRYNISVNDGTEDRGGKNNLIWLSDFAGNNSIKSDNIYIYNNTIYQGRDYKNVNSDSKIILEAKTVHFYNNIFYLENGAKVGQKSYTFDLDSPDFRKNIFFGGTVNSSFKNLDATRKEVNPQFVLPGSRHFSGYKIKSFSPAKNDAFAFTEPSFPLAGVGIFKDITSKATKDIFGTPVDLLSTSNIGADNGPGDSNLLSVLTLEAEDAIVAGGGNEINCANASGGKAMNFQEDGETLTFSNINISEAGDYLIMIYYANPNKNTLKASVNGGANETFLLPESDNFCFQSGNPTAFPIIKSLQAGNNTIQLENGIVDKIEIVAVQNATLSAEVIEAIANQSAFYLERTVVRSDQKLRLNSKSAEPITNAKISVYDLNGSRIYRGNFSNGKVEINCSNLGQGMKIFVAELEGTFFIKKFIVY